MVKLSSSDQKRIIQAIHDAEMQTRAEIHVHLSRRRVKDAYAEALKVFAKYRLHQTRERNSVLILLAPKSHTFAVIGDEGIFKRVDRQWWDQVVQSMSKPLSSGDLIGGILEGIQIVSTQLAQHFPHLTPDTNELPNNPTLD